MAKEVYKVIEPYQQFLQPIDRVQPDPKNTRGHPVRNIEALKTSLEYYQQYMPIVANAKTGYIIKGNGLWQAASELGWTHMAIVLLDRDKADSMAMSIMDNQSGDLSDFVSVALKDAFEELDTGAFDMNLTGFYEDEIAQLMTQFYEPGEGKTDEDAVPVAPARTKVGEAYELGVHRLVVGDACDISQVEKLTGGEKVDMVFTDPPSGGKKHEVMLGDEDDAVLEALKAIKIYCRGAWYICYHRTLVWKLIQALQRNDMIFHNIVIWHKSSINLSAADYKSMYEPVITGFADDYTPVFYGWEHSHVFYGPKGEPDVWEIPSVWDIDKPAKNELHPTQKPVALIDRAVKNSSLVGHTVLDLFGGSGSTMVACQKLGRRCFMMELDPKFADVIVQRWEDYTGEGAVRVEDFISVSSPTEKISVSR